MNKHKEGENLDCFHKVMGTDSTGTGEKFKLRFRERD